MAVVTPTAFRYIGRTADASGSSQIRPGGTIGGGATGDEVDEAAALLDNSTWCYAVANRSVVGQCVPFGYTNNGGAGSAEIDTNTGAAYTEACEIVCNLSEGRDAVDVEVDYGQTGGTSVTIRATAYRQDTGASITSLTINTASARVLGTIALIALTTTAILVKLETSQAGGGTGTLWNAMVYEGNATLP